ncbi:phosphodiester glycosidase family protein [Actinorhabdospora filicis]|uniref:phosphodiester glycosidase family protein n=1 Tax=Actinorhabdospora filicis TaxID=1785913 RepID=UPI0025548D67|nr:phosphodiester glycosidase family protein [Actinorhabdospora filicis]
MASALLLALLTAPPSATAAETQAEPRPIETATKTTLLAPGVTHKALDRWQPEGWLRADALTVDLSSKAEVEYLSPDRVAKVEPISEQARHRPTTVAAINGDFFDMNDTGASNGVGISDGELVKSANDGRDNAIAITPDGVGRIMQVGFEGTLTTPNGVQAIDSLNTNTVDEGEIGAYNPLWGPMSRARVVVGASKAVEVVIQNGVVATIGAPGEGDIPQGTIVLVGRGSGADRLSALKPGDAVTVAYSPKNKGLETAIGGNQLLVADGAVVPNADDAIAARSAVGFSADGTTMYLLTVDGKQTNSAGITVPQMAKMMLDLGAYNALNIDGGGSSTMLAREPGTHDLRVVNGPSDGSERPVANGLAITVPDGSGRLSGYDVRTSAAPEDAPGASTVAPGHPERVFPGLSRPLTAVGFDENRGPASGTPGSSRVQWRTDHGRVGKVGRDGVFHARNPGRTTVTASNRRADGELGIDVLGELNRVDATVERVGLSGVEGMGRFGVLGYDAAGYSAPIDPSDVELDYDRALLDITADPSGNFTVKGKTAGSAALVTATVGDRTTVVPVTVGLAEQGAAAFDDAASWKFTSARATGSVAAAPGHTGQGLKMSYDFTQSTATRAAYAEPPAMIDVPGQPQAFGMWINGNGTGEWPSLHLVDSQGTATILRGDLITWTGWRYIEMPVPAGVVYPVKIRRFYVAETRPTIAYKSEIVIDDIVAKVPPAIDVPAEATPVDPILTASVDGRKWRFAVMSDAQFVGRAPDSDIVASARRTLREIKAAKPDFLIINGDLVDEAAQIDLDLAKRVLSEELGTDLPYYYVPGNHEVMGGSIDLWKANFGEPHRVFDHKGTRFITLDTSRLNIRGGGFDQIAMLRDALDRAAEDKSVNSVVLVEHVPPRDPTPQKGSQLGDRKEAATVENWLADFARNTGKGTGFIGGHVGVFHASHVDGVPYVINGNSGKAPAGPAEGGGFIGWTEFGVNPVSAHEQRERRANPYGEPSGWLAAAFRPQTDDVVLTTPASLRAGRDATVTALLKQAGRDVPVAYPVLGEWDGSRGLCVSGWEGVDRGHRCVARFDPSTGRLEALRPGTVTLRLTVNGVTREATVTITR